MKILLGTIAAYKPSGMQRCPKYVKFCVENSLFWSKFGFHVTLLIIGRTCHLTYLNIAEYVFLSISDAIEDKH